MFEQRLHHRELPVPHGCMQRGLLVAIFCVYIGAVLQQDVNEVGMTIV